VHESGAIPITVAPSSSFFGVSSAVAEAEANWGAGAVLGTQATKSDKQNSVPVNLTNTKFFI